MLSLDVHSYSVPVKLAHCHKVQLPKGRDAAQNLHPAACTADLLSIQHRVGYQQRHAFFLAMTTEAVACFGSSAVINYPLSPRILTSPFKQGCLMTHTPPANWGMHIMRLLTVHSKRPFAPRLSGQVAEPTPHSQALHTQWRQYVDT